MTWLRNALARTVDLVFGYDFFISYKHADGAVYPRSLASRLGTEGYRVFLDEREYVPGDPLTQATKRRVRMSLYLIVIARPGAMSRSEWVVREVEVSLQAGGTPLVVDVDGAFERTIGDTDDERRRAASLRSLLNDRLRIREPSGCPADSIYDGTASDHVIAELKRAFRSTRQEVRRTRVFGAAAAVFALVSVIAVMFGIQSTRARRAAENEAARARAGELAAQARLVMPGAAQLERCSRSAPLRPSWTG